MNTTLDNIRRNWSALGRRSQLVIGVALLFLSCGGCSLLSQPSATNTKTAVTQPTVSPPTSDSAGATRIAAGRQTADARPTRTPRPEPSETIEPTTAPDATEEPTAWPTVASVKSYNEVVTAIESYCAKASEAECDAFAERYNDAKASNWTGWTADSAPVEAKYDLGKWHVYAKTSGLPDDSTDYNVTIFSDELLQDELAPNDKVSFSGDLLVSVFDKKADITLLHGTVTKVVAKAPIGPTEAPAAIQPLMQAPPPQQARRGSPTGSSCPDGLPVKGNQGKNGWIYHVPGSNSYNQTKPEECFATAADAEAAGYRAPKN